MPIKMTTPLGIFAAVLVVSACRASEQGQGQLGFTNKNMEANPFGSCAIVKGDARDGVQKEGFGSTWQFQLPPCGYQGETCFQYPTDHMDCGNPFPNVNIYSKDEQIIATFDMDSYGPNLGGELKRTSCPVNYTQYLDTDSADNETKSFDCPLTCFQCAGLCQAQASSASKREFFHDPTLQGCNAWVFCANPDGCVHDGIKTSGLSCTLKRIPLDNVHIKSLLMADGDPDVDIVPKALVDQGSSGEGSDFVSGFCNVRPTCTNNASITCESGCGNCTSCYGFPMNCGGPCCPSCPC